MKDTPLPLIGISIEEVSEQIAAGVDIEAAYYRKEQRELLQKALPRLPLAEREVVRLFLEGRTLKKIAEETELSASGVVRTLASATDRLRTMMTGGE